MKIKEEYRVNVREKQKKIIDNYGFDNQLDQLIEECAELVQAICKLKRYKSEQDKNLGYGVKSLLSLIEELGDVKNLIEQLEIGSEYIKEGIQRNMQYKVDREIGRIRKKKHE